MKQISTQVSFQMYHDQELSFQYDQNLLLFFGLHGVSRVVCEKAEHELMETGLLVVNPFELYRVACPPDAAMVCLRIDHSLLQLSGWRNSDYCSCYEQRDGNLTAEYRAIRELYARIFRSFFQDAGNQAGYVGTALQLLALLQTHFCVDDPTRSQRETGLRRMQRMLDKIHARWNEALSLSALADEEYLSASYLSRFFKKHLHTTFSQYVTELRLRHAAQMLVQQNASVTQIAYDCGFSSPSVLIEAFKQHYHQTPRQFRQEQQTRRSKQATGLPESDASGDVAPLLAYMTEETVKELPRRTVSLSVNCAVHKAPTAWRRMLNIGYARDGLLAPVQEQIRRAQAEIGFEYLRFHGLFDEDMYLYREDEHGAPQFHFAHVNLLFDFILSLGLKPDI